MKQQEFDIKKEALEFNNILDDLTLNGTKGILDQIDVLINKGSASTEEISELRERLAIFKPRYLSIVERLKASNLNEDQLNKIKSYGNMIDMIDLTIDKVEEKLGHKTVTVDDTNVNNAVEKMEKRHLSIEESKPGIKHRR